MGIVTRTRASPFDKVCIDGPVIWTYVQIVNAMDLAITACSSILDIGIGFLYSIIGV